MEKQFKKKWKRSHSCGELTEKEKNQAVVLNGWVRGLRDHGKLLFMDLWDFTGTVQVVFESQKDWSRNDFQYDTVLAIKGLVRERPEGMKNSKNPTGQIEVVAEEGALLSLAKNPPFRAGDKVNEDLALKYRYLDLRRRDDLKRSLKVRHQATQRIRNHLSSLHFQEIETPLLYKSTPEGARDFLVPSRNQTGNFYALPQSPQTLKQVLMLSGVDRYFQIAKCFRDEDLRTHRQPEFTQIDMEMSFVTEEDVREVTEGIMKELWKEFKNQTLQQIPVLSFKESEMDFGTDKPDLRNPLRLKTLDPEVIQKSKSKIFKLALSPGKSAKGLFVPKTDISRSQLDQFQKEAQSLGAKGLLWIQNQNGRYRSPLGSGVKEESLKELYESGGGNTEGCCFFVIDELGVVNKVLSKFISQLGEDYNLIDKTKDCFVWITDFPFFEYDSGLKKWSCRHHPFTSPQEEDLKLLDEENGSDLSRLKAKAYDLVCNGYELAGGSIRNSSSSLQKKIFRVLGLTEQEVKEQFGFFLEALSYGTPPHGGIAVGLERLIMILVGTNNIKDVMAFPKSSRGACLMSDSPGPVRGEHLVELGLSPQKKS